MCGGESPDPAASDSEPGSKTDSERFGLMEAVLNTLANDPGIELQRLQLEFSGGAYEEASGRFDVRLETSATRGILRSPRTMIQLSPTFNAPENVGKRTAVSDTTAFRIGASKQTRFGPGVQTGVDINRLADNLDQESAINRANLFFALNVPLLRGAGRSAAGADEEAARVVKEATAWNLHHAAATQVAGTVRAYWSCRLASVELEVLTQSEIRAAELVERVSQLVDADEIPSAELKQVRADLAEKRSARLRAEQRLFEARQTLGLAMGLNLDQVATTPLPTDSFPQPPTSPIRTSWLDSDLLQETFERRADYQALLLLRDASQVLLAQARNGLMPRVDLDMEVGYAGLDEGNGLDRFTSTVDPSDLVGLNWLATVSLSWPFGNHEARGRLRQRSAARDQNTVRIADLARNIQSAILVSGHDLNRAVAEYRQASDASSLYGDAVANEREKLGLGAASVLDVINTADRLDQARVRRVNSLARYATALVEIRFATGTLLRGERTEGQVRIDSLVLPPEWPAGEREADGADGAGRDGVRTTGPNE